MEIKFKNAARDSESKLPRDKFQQNKDNNKEEPVTIGDK